MSNNSLKKLRHVQNCVVRLVSKKGIPFGSSLDNVFMEFHWLKVRDRIIFKILLIVHNCLHQNALNEIISML